MKLRHRGVFAPKILIPLLAAGAVGIGAVSVMSLLARRGEAAISMIPSDALVAISFDNTPSAGQVALFNEIKNAMSDSGLNDYIDDFLLGLDPRTGAFKKLRSHVKGSFAVGVWGDIQQPNVMLAIALNDAAGAENIVSQITKGSRNSDGLSYYVPEQAKNGIITFYGDYAVIATNIETAKKAISVAKGEQPNLYEQAAFKEARQSLPSDASLMFFVNGEAYSKSDKNTRRFYDALGVRPKGWVATGITLRSEGVQIDTFEPESYSGQFKELLRDLRPLNYESLNKFPNGGIGLAGLSSPSVYLQLFRKTIDSIPSLGPEANKTISELESKTGTNFEKDWLPALKGDVYAAMYPPLAGSKDPGIMVSIDSSNGGAPVQLFERLVQKANDGKFDKSGSKPRFAITQEGDRKLYIPSDSKDAFLTSDGQRLMLFNSRDLMARAGKDSEGSILDSQSLASFTKGEPAQFRVNLDMYALSDMLSQLQKDDSEFNLKQILSSRNLTVTALYDGKTATMSILIPVNIPELIRVAGKKAKENGVPLNERQRRSSGIAAPGALPVSPGEVAKGPLGKM